MLRIVLVSCFLLIPTLPVGAGTPPPGFVETQIITGAAGTGVEDATAAAFEPGSDNLFVLEKTGRVRVRSAATGTVSTALTIPCVDSAGERGLLGIAFSPDYLESSAGRWVYIYYTRRLEPGACELAGQPTGTRFQVSRFLENGGSLSAEEVILIGPFLQAATNHNAGAIQFAPDGTLFIATGDNDTDAAPAPLSRDMSDLRGKILRVNADGSIPPDNPFVGVAGVREEIWAFGLRNPFRFRFDTETGAPILADVGEGTLEAVYQGIPGADYGYPCFEGSASFRVCDPAPPPGSVTDPIYEYRRDGQTDPVTGNSITGGPVYRDTGFPEDYQDNYYFGDFGRGWIFRGRFAVDGTLVDVEEFMPDANGIVDMLVSPSGCLIWVSYWGGVREVCYSGGGNGQPTAVATADTMSGLAPLDVLFDGSQSSDPDSQPLAFDWDFQDPPGSTEQSPSHSFTQNGVYDVLLTVDDGQGEPNSSDSAPVLRVVVGNRAPTAVLEEPQVNSTYDAGDTILFSGTGTDPEEGPLAASRFSWTVVFHHDTHTHPFLGPLTGIPSGTFDIPTTGEDATDVFYRIHLRVTDNGSPAHLSHATFVDVEPNLSDLTLEASPPGAGIDLEFDRRSAPAPTTYPSVVNFPRTIGAPSPQSSAGETYFFQSWSDGGAAEHGIDTPAGDTTYTATYAPCSAAMDDRVLTGDDVDSEITEEACLTIVAGTSYRVLTNGVLTLRSGVSITLDNGFSVEAGELTVDLTPPI